MTKFLSRAFLRVSVAILSAPILVGLAQANPLPERWEAERQRINTLLDQVCSGNPDAEKTFWKEIEIKKNPIAFNALGWLSHNCPNIKLTDEELTDWLRKSAEAGYPWGMRNYAMRLLFGIGTPKDVDGGLRVFERAIGIGYGDPRSDLVFVIERFSFDPPGKATLRQAKKLLELAERKSVSEKKLTSLRTQIENTQAFVDAFGDAFAPDKTKKKETPKKVQRYAALATSLPDGSYGLAHDEDDKDTATTVALGECILNGGKNCSIKVLGYGKLCIAYHFTPDSPTAHGWYGTIGKERVNSNAADECRRRNGGATCQGQVSVCNERSNTFIASLIQDERMPTVPIKRPPRDDTVISGLGKVGPANRAPDLTDLARYSNGQTPQRTASEQKAFEDYLRD